MKLPVVSDLWITEFSRTWELERLLKVVIDKLGEYLKSIIVLKQDQLW